MNAKLNSTDSVDHSLWHILQISDVLDMEFASALCRGVVGEVLEGSLAAASRSLFPSCRVLAWEPQRVLWPTRIPAGTEQERHSDGNSRLRIRSLPLIRGFARAPISWFSRIGPTVLARLLAQTPNPESSPLICTIPYFAPVAELWPGPVVYWLTDLIAAYASANRGQVEQLDRRMCAAATLVCPNSVRLAEYLIERCGCDPLKIQVLPNATRAANLLPQAPETPATSPTSIAAIPRPFAGVIGNLAGNMDWTLLERTIALTPWLQWVFVGPTTMKIPNYVERAARQSVMRHPRAHFIGRQPYGELASFARSFDVAVLPYKRREPTYSGSSTRFYEHLAACRPMIGTPALEELTRKTPLLELVNTAEEAAMALERLRANEFNDGLLAERWEQSFGGTWEARVATLRSALAARLFTSNASTKVRSAG